MEQITNVEFLIGTDDIAHDRHDRIGEINTKSQVCTHIVVHSCVRAFGWD